jgi:predicted kinase
MKKSIFIVCGNLGSGKTTTANMLGRMINAPVMSADPTIKRLFKKPSNTGKDAPFNDKEIEICYNCFCLISEYLLSVGSSAIIDAACPYKSQREKFILLAKKSHVPYYFLYMNCPPELIKKRAMKRFASGKGVGWKAHVKFKKKYEPFDIKHRVIDTSKDVKVQLNLFLRGKGL